MDSANQVSSELSQRINQLATLSEDSLKDEMQALKKTILENPAACLLLAEEDIGELVDHLRKITGKAIVLAATPKKKSSTTEPKAKKKLSAAELAAALDDEDF
jgi:cytochrome c553